MTRKDTYELLTALADNEIKDQQQIIELQSMIASDQDLRFEYNVQLTIKNLIRQKCAVKSTPLPVRNKIINQLNKPLQKSYGFSSSFIKYGTAAAIILAIILLLFNRTDKVPQPEFALEQKGTDNMYVQAKQNFESILAGKLKPQIVTSDPNMIQDYFASHGVKYHTIVPKYGKWTLAGAVVSEDKGEKFAHHVYTAPNGELIYLFQVDEKYLQTHEILRLSSDLLQYLENGNCYSYSEGNVSTLLTKADHNIIAVVSNLKKDELMNNFCSIN